MSTWRRPDIEAMRLLASGRHTFHDEYAGFKPGIGTYEARVALLDGASPGIGTSTIVAAKAAR